MISRNINKSYSKIATQLSIPVATSNNSISTRSIINFRGIINNNLNYGSRQNVLSLKQSFVKSTTIVPPSSTTSLVNSTIQTNRLFNELKRYTTSSSSSSSPNNSNNSNSNSNKNEIKEQKQHQQQQQVESQKDNSNKVDNNKPDKDDDDDDKIDVKKLSTGEKIKYLLKKYGKIALVVHFGVYFLTMGSFYALFSSGVDVTKVLEFLHLPADKINPSLGAFAVAFACTKLSTFVRTPLTLITVPIIARYLGRVKK